MKKISAVVILLAVFIFPLHTHAATFAQTIKSLQAQVSKLTATITQLKGENLALVTMIDSSTVPYSSPTPTPYVTTTPYPTGAPRPTGTSYFSTSTPTTTPSVTTTTTIAPVGTVIPPQILVAPSNLDNARNKAKNASIRVTLSNIQTQAIFLNQANGNFNKVCGANGTIQDPVIADLISKMTLPSGGTVVCGKPATGNATSYAVATPLWPVTGGNPYYCTDSTGYFSESTTNISQTTTACPHTLTEVSFYQPYTTLRLVTPSPTSTGFRLIDLKTKIFTYRVALPTGVTVTKVELFEDDIKSTDLPFNFINQNSTNPLSKSLSLGVWASRVSPIVPGFYTLTLKVTDSTGRVTEANGYYDILPAL